MPTKNVVLTVQSPVGGINRRAAYQTQAPFTAYDAQNFWPIDTRTGRVTTATRPALNLFGTLQTEVNMLSKVSGIRAGHPSKSFAAAYEGQIYYWNGSTLVTATGAQAASVNQGSYVSATPIIDELIICDDTLAPIAFDYSTGAAATLVASAGTVPVGASIAVTWQGALWLVVDDVLHASRVGDTTDWDTSASLDDLFGSFFTAGDYKGVIAGPITAVMPQTSDVMMVSTVSGTLAMRGHPRQGGVFEPVGSTYVLGQGAWCQLPDGTLLMLTPNGLMSLAPTPGAVMAPISRERIPDELIALAYDRDDPLINMIYDTRWNGVHIYVRGVQEQAWWFDLNTGGFFRMEIASYPLTVAEFPDFVTESTSGVLLGRYNGIYEYDRFATETITSSLVAGPVKISADTMKASKIHNVRVTFARDTPNDLVGTFKVSAGLDGQDAVNRLLNGEEQYSVDLASLEANNGMCYPAVAGHAAVFAFATETGDVSIEEITVNVGQMGQLSMNRGTQIAVSGEATEFTGTFIELDNDVWAGYSEATPEESPSEALPEYTHFLDLSRMPTSWWDEVTGPTGEDIRVSDNLDVEFPSSLIDFSLANQEGMIAFKRNAAVVPRSVRLWVGNPAALTPAPTDTNGQYNAYDSNWRSFWPDGGSTNNQTSFGDNDEDSNAANGVADDLAQFYGVEDGPMGAKATDFNQGNNTHWFKENWVTLQGLLSQTAWTFIGCFRRTDNEVIQDNILTLAGSGVQDHVLRADEDTDRAFTRMTTSDTGSGEAQSSFSVDPDLAWVHHAGVVVGDTERHAYVEGIGKGSNTTDLSPIVDDLIIGDNFVHPNGWESMIQIHTTARNDAWVEYQAAMLDQPTFWGTIGAFVLVNTIPEDALLTTACPTGSVPQTEAGTTDGYALITPTDPSDGSVIKFSHLIDLSILPASWWSAVSSAGLDGVDIRATDIGNNFLPFDLIEINVTDSTGLAVVRQTQADGSPTGIRIWAGNSSAITVDVCNLYGQYLAYDSLWRGFWPDGGTDDRTQYQNDLTGVGSPSAISAGSPLGSSATTYSNATGTSQYAIATNLVPSENPLTLMASIVKPAGSIHTDSVIMAVQDASNLAGVFLKTRPSSTPARMVTRNAFGTEGAAGYSGSIVATSNWFQAGTSFGNHTRIAYADTLSGSSSSPQTTIIVNNLDTIIIGAENASTPIRGMDATISLAGLHATPRGTAWLKYWNKSLTQGTFWTVGSWVSDPTALS